MSELFIIYETTDNKNSKFRNTCNIFYHFIKSAKEIKYYYVKLN